MAVVIEDPEADVDTEVTILVLANSLDDPVCLVARWTDANNWYSAGMYNVPMRGA